MYQYSIRMERIADKKYKDRKLHSIITSEEAKFWKFISKGKYLDEERINLDNEIKFFKTIKFCIWHFLRVMKVLGLIH